MADKEDTPVQYQTILTRKINARDYTGDVISDFIKRIEKDWNLTPEIIESIKSNLQSALFPYYVTVTHPDNVDWSGKKKKRDPNNKPPMTKRNKYVKYQMSNEVIMALPFEKRMGAISQMWNNETGEIHKYYETISVDDFEKLMIEQYDKLRQKGLMDEKKYTTKIKDLKEDMALQKVLENKKRIRDEEKTLKALKSKTTSSVELPETSIPTPVAPVEIPAPAPTQSDVVLEIKTQQRGKRRGKVTK